MNEQEIKNLLSVYQQKVNDLTAQTIALEARIMNLNQLIEALNKKMNELNSENQDLTSLKTKRASKETIEKDFS